MASAGHSGKDKGFQPTLFGEMPAGPSRSADGRGRRLSLETRVLRTTGTGLHDVLQISRLMSAFAFNGLRRLYIGVDLRRRGANFPHPHTPL